jgi:integrase
MTGARVSEVLRLRHCDIDNMGLISIPSSKGSYSRVLSVDLTLFKRYLKPEVPAQIFTNLSRFCVHRKLIEWGCYFTKEGSSNKAVTHVCRNIYAYRMQRMGIGGEQLSNGLGHKSMKSRVYYERKIIK